MKSVVIAEDDPTLAVVLEEILRERLALSTYVVPNGALVTDAIAERHPDLLILDVALPGLSGLDVFDLVKSSPAYAGVPVLFLTGSPDQARAAAKDSRVIAKPFEIDVLVNAIAEMLGTVPAGS